MYAHRVFAIQFYKDYCCTVAEERVAYTEHALTRTFLSFQNNKRFQSIIINY